MTEHPRARRWLRYGVTLPERGLRATFAAAGGLVHETAQVVLPRVVRGSRLYEATAKNALRVAVELVGGVVDPRAEPDQVSAGRIAVKKTAGNVVEVGAIAAIGFSPLWLLAAAADVLNGSRVYLRTLERELQAAGILASDVHFASVDQLVGALEGTVGNAARMIDLPPVELAELKQSITEFRSDAGSLPAPAEMASLFNALVRTAREERRSLLEVSSGVGLAFLHSAGQLTQEHLVTPYRQDWARLRGEGFGAYAARVGEPYRRAITGHFDPSRSTLTERASRGASGWARARWAGWRARRGG